MKETTPPKDPKKKLWIGYSIVIAILFACNLFLFPAMMQAKVKSVNYSTFLQMLENKQLSTVQIEDQQIFFVDNEKNSYKTNAIAQDNNLVTRLEDAGVEFAAADDFVVLVAEPLHWQKDAEYGRRKLDAVRRRKIRCQAVCGGRQDRYQIP